MKKIVVFSLLIMLVVNSHLFAQEILNNKPGSENILDNKTGALSPPVPVKLFYNNFEANGYLISGYNELFVSIDALRTLFNFSDSTNTDSGSYLVNGNAVDTYYYANHLYLDLTDFCNAMRVTPRVTNDKTGVIFVARPVVQTTTTTLPNNPPVSVVIQNQTVGDTSNPINSSSYIFTVALTNQSSSPISLNHFNFIVQGQSGQKYVSVKTMGYAVVYGGNDTDDTVVLDPGQVHIINLTFDLPGNDNPRNFIVMKDMKIIGMTYTQ